MKALDMFNRQIIVGDIIVYPVRLGSSMWMNVALVHTLKELKDWDHKKYMSAGTYIVSNKVLKKTFFSCFNRCIKLNKEMLSFDYNLLIDKQDEMLNPWIPLKDCIDGNLYKIDARNGELGIFTKKDSGFVLSRFKFGDNFLFTEYHWDTGMPHGTVKPRMDLGVFPKNDTSLSDDEFKRTKLNRLTMLEKEIT